MDHLMPEVMSSELQVGTVSEITEDGFVWVSANSAEEPPVRAMIGTPASDEISEGCAVLLGILSNENRPIVLAVIRDRLAKPDGPPDVQTIEASKQLVLRCGKSSIELRDDGKLLVSGAELTSRATRLNRIKGSSVAIN